MRLLENAGIPFETGEYEVDESDLSGVHAAKVLGLDPDCMFKTLVCRDDRGGYQVFCIPVAYELDLKKCAAAAGVKRCEMIHVKELLPLTGYIRGGCSPVGMKKKFPTCIDETAVLCEKISVSAGQRGLQLFVNPEALRSFLDAKFADLIR
jgi:Cys-tRNA(Pro)/Cys-tRNA(Cys) deacylase